MHSSSTVAVHRGQTIIIESAEELSRNLSPEGYHPIWDGRPCVSATMETAHRHRNYPLWRMDFASGSNRLHFVLFDQNAGIHTVEQIGFGGPYEACGPGYDEQYDNAYDAFWRAEIEAGKYTNPKHGHANPSFSTRLTQSTLHPVVAPPP